MAFKVLVVDDEVNSCTMIADYLTDGGYDVITANDAESGIELIKNDNFNINEPFKGLFTQGMVCHETYKDKHSNWVSPEDIVTINGKKYLKNNRSEEVKVGASESMSKSKKNAIDPENIIQLYGADAVRLFILSDSPPEKDVQWSDDGIISSYKFLQKLWILVLILKK